MLIGINRSLGLQPPQSRALVLLHRNNDGVGLMHQVSVVALPIAKELCQRLTRRWILHRTRTHLPAKSGWGKPFPHVWRETTAQKKFMWRSVFSHWERTDEETSKGPCFHVCWECAFNGCAFKKRHQLDHRRPRRAKKGSAACSPCDLVQDGFGWCQTRQSEAGRSCLPWESQQAAFSTKFGRNSA